MNLRPAPPPTPLSHPSAAPFRGYLDRNDGSTVEGWACDARRPDTPVEIEFRFSSGLNGAVLADEFRPDLLAAGIGHGRHGFRFALPLQPAAAAAVQLTARIRGTDFVLSGSPMTLNPRQVIGLVAGDIVSNCNLRCPFCVVDYANVRGLSVMTEETFRRALPLLPGMAPGSFWLSCLHEPTLHPRFLELIEQVPAALRDRLSFTTNLCKKLPDSFLERLAHSGVDHIRVSFDSREPARFAALRKGGQLEVFAHNLTRLRDCLRASRPRPKLHFVTMAFQDNAREIAALVRHARDEIGADSHEVRFPFYGPHLADWVGQHLLDPAAWAELERELAPLQATGKLDVFGPEGRVREQFATREGVSGYVSPVAPFGGEPGQAPSPPPDPEKIGRLMPDELLRLHLRWDGLVLAQQLPEEVFRVNLNQLERPADYFEAIGFSAKAARPAPPLAAAPRAG